MTTSKRKKIYFVVFWIILIISFVFFAVILVAFANGYHLNLKTGHLQKTAMIIVDGNTSSPTIFLNSKERQGNFPQRFTRLSPGRYEIEVTKSDYQDWEKIINVQGGEAKTLNDITLFLKTPLVAEDATQTPASVTEKYQNQNQDIQTNSSELRYQNNLITRFSQNIIGAVYDKNSNHFFVQLDKEIHVLDFDGSNNLLLTSLPTAQSTPFFIDNNYLDYAIGTSVYQAKIR